MPIQMSFALQLVLIEALLAHKLERRNYFWLRCGVAIVAYVVFSWLFPHVAFGWFIPVVPAVFLFSLVCLWFCFDQKMQTVLFVAISAYSIQHLSDNVYRILQSFLALTDGSLGDFVAQFLCLLVFYLVGTVLFSKQIKQAEQNHIAVGMLLGMSSFVLVVNFLLCSVALFDGYSRYIVIHLYAICCCVLILFCLYGLSFQEKLKNEKRMIEQLLYENEKNERLVQETVDIINMKCHDIKHQIAMLRQGKIDHSELEGIERAIGIYDSFVQIGDEIVDSLIASKGLLLEKYKIKFSCVADRSTLDFLSGADKISLFGNALDNAIESVLQEPEDLRVISFSIRKKQENILCIRMENYCSRSLVLEEGLPVSTKGDSRFHGFGMKSIRYIVEQHQGVLSIELEDNIFALNILFFLDK